MSKPDMNAAASRLRWGVPLLLMLALPFASGCYQYAPVAYPTLAVDSEVRAHLSLAEIERLGLNELVPIEARTVEGKVLRNEPDTLALLVRVTSAQDWGFRDRDLNQRLSILWNSILELELKELNRGKTGMLAGIGAAAFISLVVNNLSGWFGGRAEAEAPEKDGIGLN